MKLKLYRAKTERREGRKLYGTTKLRDYNIKKQFHIAIEIRNRIEQDWLHLETAYCVGECKCCYQGKEKDHDQVKLDKCPNIQPIQVNGFENADQGAACASRVRSELLKDDSKIKREG